MSCGEPYAGPSAHFTAPVKLIGSKSEIDNSAVDERVAGLPGVVAAFGMPDLHTGCTVISKGCMYQAATLGVELRFLEPVA